MSSPAVLQPRWTDWRNGIGAARIVRTISEANLREEKHIAKIRAINEFEPFWGWQGRSERPNDANGKYVREFATAKLDTYVNLLLQIFRRTGYEQRWAGAKAAAPALPGQSPRKLDQALLFGRIPIKFRSCPTKTLGM